MKNIASALVKAQKNFAPALKTSSNPHFRSKYADLAACVEAVVDALNGAGIALMQRCHECDDGVIVETVFVHESGETMDAGKLHVPASKADPQGYGSALTYARRYSLMAACGIAPEDDDGNAASGKNKSAAPPAPPQAQKPFDLDAALAWISKGQTIDEVKQRARSAYRKASTNEEHSRIQILVQELEKAALASA
ncbi:ERF family protein [Pseudothauera rhizosphaerae]|nr:ERF family protein [Pseudothauera rhizosphaerae]